MHFGGDFWVLQDFKRLPCMTIFSPCPAVASSNEKMQSREQAPRDMSGGTPRTAIVYALDDGVLVARLKHLNESE